MTSLVKHNLDATLRGLESKLQWAIKQQKQHTNDPQTVAYWQGQENALSAAIQSIRYNFGYSDPNNV